MIVLQVTNKELKLVKLGVFCESWPDNSLDNVDHCDGKTGYLPDRKQKVVCKPHLGLHTATWSSAYFPTHKTIQALYALCQSEATSQDNQRSLKSICRAHNLRALKKICFNRCTFGVCKCLLWWQRISVRIFSIRKCDCICSQVAKYQLSEQSVAK